MSSFLPAGRSTPSSTTWISAVSRALTRRGFPNRRWGNRDQMRTLGWWTLGWLALAALWLLYQGEWNAIQIYAAAAAAALSLLVAFVLRRHALPPVRVERRWLVRAARIPWQVVREFGIVTLFLVRRRAREGEFRRLPFPAGGARPARPRGRVAGVLGFVPLFLGGGRAGGGGSRGLPSPAGGARPADRGRRAFIALATGYSPNSYVLDVDEEQGEVLVHVLERVPSGEELV